MKKNLLFGMLASMMLASATVTFAQDPYYYEDYKTIKVYSTVPDEYIEIDGVDNEPSWSAPGVTEHAIDRILHNWGETPVDNSWGYAASYKAVYDENYLYLFVKVSDDSYVPYSEQMTSDTNIDNIEIFFFPDVEGRDMVDASAPDARPKGLSQLRVSVGNTENRATGGGRAMQSAQNGQITGYEYTTVETATGYHVEIVVPWDILVDNPSYLETGTKILFDINPANCIDYASGRVIILGWSTDDFNSWKYNYKLGEMEFGGVYSSIHTPQLANIRYTLRDGQLQLSGLNGKTAIEIYDVSGRKALSVKGNTADISALATGVYVVNVQGLGKFKIVK
ncbi:MAG: T9SS type A sorting domain-containing protein [Dysgonamonadaceae bacterium]|nr:T9SS type A sorting domain-containing protein [Dysgonamonadaceae bacterium]